MRPRPALKLAACSLTFAALTIAAAGAIASHAGSGSHTTAGTTSGTTSGATSAAGDDWLPIPPEDLALKDNPKQPGSDAMILYRSSRLESAKGLRGGPEVNEYLRIKIFTARGADEESSPSISFIKGYSTIKNLEARTIEPGGTIVNFTGQPYEKTVEKSGDYRSMEQTFTFPQVQPGCIIEYKFSRVSVFNVVWQDWTITGQLFTRDAVFSFHPPAPPAGATLNFRSSNLSKELQPTRQPDGSFQMEVHNIAGVQEEPLMPPSHVLEARVEFFYRYPWMGEAKNPDEFWNAAGKRFGEGIDKYIDRKHALEKIVGETVAPGDTAEQKLRKLYDRALKIHNVEFDDEKSQAERKVEKLKNNESIEDVIKHGYGDSADVNWYFLGLARAAGFKAEAVFLAPRDRTVFIPNGEDFSQLETTLVWVQADKAEYWLDPAAKFYPFGLLPWNETESKGIRLSAKGADIITTPQQSSGDSVTLRHVELTLADDGSASGTFEITFTGSAAALRRASLASDDDLGRKKSLNEEFTSRLAENSDVAVTELVDWDDIAKPLVVRGTLKMLALGTVAGSRVMVPVAVFSSAYTGDFTSETRVNAIRFTQRSEEIDDAVIHAPAGYTVEALPKLREIKSGDLLDYNVDVSQTNSAIEIKRRFVLGGISFPRDQYAALRGLFMNIKSLDDSQVVLSSGGEAKPATASATSPTKK